MSDSFIELLIVAVRKANLLWDMADRRYHNRLLVDREWTRIARELGETKEIVKGKWKNLRDTFKKELKKVRRCKSGDGAEEGEAYRYTGSWCHFEAMQFLQRITTPRETEGNLSVSQDTDTVEQESQQPESQQDGSYQSQVQEDEEEEEEFSQNDIIESAVSSKSSNSSAKIQKNRLQRELEDLEKSLPSATRPTNPIPVAVSRKRKHKTIQNQETKFEHDMLLLEAKKLELLSKNTDDDDEDINFFKSLLPHVQQLPPINKLYFRTRIQTLLCEELTKLQAPNNPYSQSTSSTTVSSPWSPHSSHDNYLLHELN